MISTINAAAGFPLRRISRAQESKIRNAIVVLGADPDRANDNQVDGGRMRIQKYVQAVGEPIVLDDRWRDHVENPLPYLVAAVGTASSPLLKQPLDPSGLGVQHQRGHAAKASAATTAQLRFGACPAPACHRRRAPAQAGCSVPPTQRLPAARFALGENELLDFALLELSEQGAAVAHRLSDRAELVGADAKRWGIAGHFVDDGKRGPGQMTTDCRQIVGVGLSTSSRPSFGLVVASRIQMDLVADLRSTRR
jgi:hypothetical protein